jgi:hypothetical protein
VTDERWPDYTVVARELQLIRQEKRKAAFLKKIQYYGGFRLRMKDDYDFERISRRSSMREFKARMSAIEQRIVDEQKQDGRPIGD